MKKKWYRNNLTKGILLILAHTALILAVLCVVALAELADAGVYPTDIGKETYGETSKFAQEVYFAGQNILQGIKYGQMAERFHDKGKQAVIDLKEFGDGEEYSYKNTSGLAYSLEELEQWADEGWESGYGLFGYTVLVCEKTDGTYQYFQYEEFARKIQTGELKFSLRETEGYGEEDMVSQLLEEIRQGNLQDWDYRVRGILDEKGNEKYTSIWNYAGYSVREEYAPEGADSILDIVNEDSYWNGRLEEANILLGQLLEEINRYRSEGNILEEYEEGNTNLTYFFADLENEEVYTNKEVYGEFQDYSRSLKEMTKNGYYVVVEPKLADSISNMDTDLLMWQHMTQGMGGREKFIYAVKIDKDFPVRDIFYEYKETYDKYSSWLLPVFAVGIAAIILFFGCLVWLTVIAGRRPEDEELYLCDFDGWFTEISALLVLGIWLLGSFWCFDYLSHGSLRSVIGMGFWGFFTAAMFLTGYLSLVRRIKGKILWKNSLLLWLFRGVRRLFKGIKDFLNDCALEMHSVVKTILLAAGFLLAQIFVVAISGSIFLGLLFTDAALLAYYIWKAAGWQMILNGLRRITDGELQYKIPAEKLRGEQQIMAEYINHIGDGLDAAVESSLKNERMKTELITNVSHDIKTPLTSIINYVDLLKRENFQDPKICGYLDVLEEKAQRLKSLTEDVVEASKASTGNITLEMSRLDFVEMVRQVMGEFEEKFEERNLHMVGNLGEEPVMIRADGRRLWRVLANVFNNASKYAMEGTRVYVELKRQESLVILSLKNISQQPLNISADELTERFIRGDVSRSTEGSGLGLSIAKSLTELQGGNFVLYLDGDLFKVVISFSIVG